MTFGEGEKSPESLEAVQERLKSEYKDREKHAIRLIQAGETVDNPILTGETGDDRYSVTTIGFIKGQVEEYLQKVETQLKAVEPDIHFVPRSFQHVTLRDLEFNEKGRKAAGIDAVAVRTYYQALQKGFTHPPGSINLQLYRVMPSIDRPQNSVSIVAAFLPNKDTKILEVKKQMSDIIGQTGLPIVERPGGYDVIFSTVGRFPHPPKAVGGSVPFLDTLHRINKSIPKDSDAAIDTIDILSTGPGKWSDVARHVYLIPPVSLIDANPPNDGHFVRASHRKMLDKIK